MTDLFRTLVRRGGRPGRAVWLVVLSLLLTALSVLPAAAIPAAARMGFFIGPDGGLVSYSGSPSTSATPVGPAGLAPAGAPLTATRAQDGTAVTHFVGVDGAVYEYCPTQTQPSAITNPGVATPGSPLGSALAGQRVILAFEGANNDLDFGAEIVNPCGPVPPRPVLLYDRPGGLAARSNIAVVGLPDGGAGAIYVDTAGELRALWLSAVNAVTDVVLTPAGTASPGGGVAVTPNLALFYTGHDGRVYLAHLTAGGGIAAGPRPHPWDVAAIPDGAPLSAGSGPLGEVAAAVAGNGSVVLFTADNAGNWRSAGAVTGAGFTAVGSAAGATSDDDGYSVYCGNNGVPGHLGIPPRPGLGVWWPTGSTNLAPPGTNFTAA